jgi:hypothetical protein
MNLPCHPRCCDSRTPWWRSRGYTRGRQPSCGGSRQHRCVPALFAGGQRAPGVGGHPPAPAFPSGETGKGVQIPCCRRPILPTHSGLARCLGICPHVPHYSLRLNGSERPGSARPTAFGSGSAPVSSAGSCPTWRSHCGAPGTVALLPLPHSETSLAS